MTAVVEWIDAVVVIGWGSPCGPSVLFSLAVHVVTHEALRRRPGIGPRPPISILRPLCGLDDGLRENLEALVRQDYPEFEIIADRPIRQREVDVRAIHRERLPHRLKFHEARRRPCEHSSSADDPRAYEPNSTSIKSRGVVDSRREVV